LNSEKIRGLILTLYTIGEGNSNKKQKFQQTQQTQQTIKSELNVEFKKSKQKIH